MTPNEEAANRLRMFTQHWSVPEQLLVENIISDLAGGDGRRSIAPFGVSNQIARPTAIPARETVVAA
jgi:hypothetical protein